MVHFGGGKHQEIMMYNDVLEALSKNLEGILDDRMYTFKSVESHRKVGNTWDVQVKWDYESLTSEPISLIAKLLQLCRIITT